MNKDLKKSLNEGNGIATIYGLIDCPNCKKDIWVECGQHCGMDATLEGSVNTICYECLDDVHIEMELPKDVGFMNITESAKFFNDKFKIKNE